MSQIQIHDPSESEFFCDEFEVWFDTGEHRRAFTALCVGRGSTRNAAITDAMAEMGEAIHRLSDQLTDESTEA